MHVITISWLILGNWDGREWSVETTANPLGFRGFRDGQQGGGHILTHGASKGACDYRTLDSTNSLGSGEGEVPEVSSKERYHC